MMAETLCRAHGLRGVSIVRLLVCISLMSAPAAAQAPDAPDPHVAQPERPSVATHAHTVAPGWLELEAGGERDSADGEYTGFVLPVAIKVGLSARTQLSIFTGVARPAGGATFDASDLGVSVKWRIADAVPFFGAVAIQPGVIISSAAGDAERTVGANLLIIASRSAGPVGIDANVGFTRRSGTGADAPRSETLWAIAPGGALARRVGWVAELFGYPATSGPSGQRSTTAMLVGATFTWRPSVVFDAGLIAPLSGPQSRALFAGGVWNAGRIWRPRP